jgi:hypothetical protein
MVWYERGRYAVVIVFNLLLVSQLIKMMSIGADSLSFTTFTQRMGLARPSGAYLQVLGVDYCVGIRESRGVGIVAQERLQRKGDC